MSKIRQDKAVRNRDDLAKVYEKDQVYGDYIPEFEKDPQQRN